MSKINKNPLGWIDEKKQEEEKKKPVIRSSSQEGLEDDWTRATFIVRKDLLKGLKDLAYTNRTAYKDEINNAIKEYLEGKEIIEDPKLKEK